MFPDSKWIVTPYTATALAMEKECVYFKEKFRPEMDISKQEYQMSLFCSDEYDVICVYRSTDNSSAGILNFLEDLNELINRNRRTFIVGDFNIIFPDNPISRELFSVDFDNVVTKPTHIDGNLIDHLYTNIRKDEIFLKQTPVYYSDHDLLKLAV